jgi:nitroreductase
MEETMEFYQCVESRTSFRSFTSQEVDKRILTRILEAANRSPSDMNTQPWEVFVVTGEKKDILAKKLLDEVLSGKDYSPDLSFSEASPDHIERRAREHRLRRFEALGIDPADQKTVRQNFLRNFEFYGAPCVIFIGMEKSLSPWSLLDLGLFTGSVLLAAEAEDLGCCVQTMPLAYPDLLRQELGISPNIALFVAVCIGYPDRADQINKYHSTRRELNEFVKWYGLAD